jgi:MSHA pilin protein MshC
LSVPRGFTLVELIAVILIGAILSFVAMGKLNNMGEVNAQGFADEVASQLRYAQKTAIAQRTVVYVNVAAATEHVTSCFDSATPICAQELVLPTGDNADITGPSSATMTSTVSQFSFNGLGTPSTASVVTLVVTATSSGAPFTVTVQPVSGYVQRN